MTSDQATGPFGPFHSPSAARPPSRIRLAGPAVGEPGEQSGHAPLVRPDGEQARQRGRAGRVGVHVGGHVHAAGAGGLDRPEDLAHLGPVGLEAGLQVGHLDGHPALVADPDGFRDRRLERRALPPDVGGVEPAGPAAERRRQPDQLGGVRVDARRVDEPCRHTEGPGVERLAEQGVHVTGLVRAGRPPLESHGRDPERAVADEGGDVAGEPRRAQPVQPGAEAGPRPVELGREEGRPLPEQAAPRRRRGRGEAAHARHLGGDALPDLGLRGGIGEQGEVGVGVHVDEPGRDHAPRGIDHPGGFAREVGRDRRDAVPGERDVRPAPRGPGPVEDRAPADQPVKRHAVLRLAGRRCAGRAPVPGQGLASSILTVFILSPALSRSTTSMPDVTWPKIV